MLLRTCRWDCLASPCLSDLACQSLARRVNPAADMLRPPPPLQSNLFEDISLTQFPAYVLSGDMCISRAELRLTHVGGTSNGVLAFAELYSALGNYVAWQALVSGDPEKGAAPCIEFESAMVQGAGYYWLAHPRANTNAKLVGFVDRVLEHHALHDVRPARCREVIVYAPRRGMCRAVRNSDAVVQTIRAAAPRHEVVARDLATMGILQQFLAASTAAAAGSAGMPPILQPSDPFQ